ncbi:aspartate-semialdehyde dehydrogenase [Pseudostreptobacillus hongkongensis]|uniref:aspartate-semialdehyde dehydrogenase n=1 Tax=Pseudostreptobacillus hongkongensis TaxID=1162717 RepID=UPI000829A14F|nr:aspartate-semialdehyde dehydrogenase [Pseudostreptobacillus hongkongensis]
MKNLAIVGATGLVGSTFLKVIEERKIPFNKLYLYASKRSAGKKIEFLGKEYEVIELKEENIKDDIDFALFSAGGSISTEFAPKFAKHGAIVIDNSSAWRMDNEVPLIVPEANPEAINDIKKGIIANPNCSTIQCMPVLKALDKAYGLERVIYSTYQSVSGAGMNGLKDLDRNLNGEESQNFPYQIAFNLIPHIDVFLDNGYTKEEMKMVNETRKILSLPELRISATCVRVPIRYSHSISVNVEFKNEFDLNELKEILRNTKNVIVEDDVNNKIYPMPINAEGTDEVYVGRIRRDESVKNGVNLWIVSDNIRKGAATNTVQILELFL